MSQYAAKRCSRCGATWKGTEPLPVVCPECDGPADDHEHQFPEVIIEGDRVLFPCLLCSLPALDAIAQLKVEHQGPSDELVEALEQRDEAEADAIEAVVSQWVIQGGATQFGRIDEPPTPSNAHEVVAAILSVFTASAEVVSTLQNVALERIVAACGTAAGEGNHRLLQQIRFLAQDALKAAEVVSQPSQEDKC